MTKKRHLELTALCVVAVWLGAIGLQRAQAGTATGTGVTAYTNPWSSVVFSYDVAGGWEEQSTADKLFNNYLWTPFANYAALKKSDAGQATPGTYLEAVNGGGSFSYQTIITYDGQPNYGAGRNDPFTLKTANGAPGDWGTVSAVASGPGLNNTSPITVTTLSSPQTADRLRLDWSQSQHNTTDA